MRLWPVEIKVYALNLIHAHGRFFLCPSLFVYVFVGFCFPYRLSHIFSHLLWFILSLFLAILQDDSLFGPDHKIIYRPPAIFCIVPELGCQTQFTEQRSVHVSVRFEMHVNALTVIYTSWLTRHGCFFWREDTFAESSLRARHFATLYFIFVADSAESELGVLDLIQASANSFVTFAYFSARREDYIMQCLNQSVTNLSRN